MLGCDLHCGYCQNWVTSQALRDPAAAVGPMRVTSAELVLDALRQRGRVIVSTYNEPLITSEWAVVVFKEARAAGLVTGFVSNGNGTPQVLEYLRPWVDLYKVDLKSFDDRHYRQLGGRLQPILDTICLLHDIGFLAGDRYAGDSRVQRLRRRTDSIGRVRGGRVAGYSLACDCVSQRLQND
jgi:pyruvate formate lyase activating enzyme